MAEVQGRLLWGVVLDLVLFYLQLIVLDDLLELFNVFDQLWFNLLEPLLLAVVF
jgi:hypothetical protein